MALNCVGLSVTHAFPYPLARAGHMALPIPRGLENVCMGAVRRYPASIAVVYHSCPFILGCFCMFSSCLPVLSRMLALCAMLKLLSASEGTFLSLLCLWAWGSAGVVLLFRPPAPYMYVCLLPPFLTIRMLSTLCRADFEAHHIPRSRLGKSGRC